MTLNASGWPATTRTVAPARSARPASSVRRRAGVRVGPLEHVPAEALRGLHRAQPAAVDGGDDAVAVDLLDGVGHRHNRDHGLGTGAYGVDHPLHHLDRDQAAGGVVHQHDVVGGVAARPVRPRRSSAGDRRPPRPTSRSRSPAASQHRLHLGEGVRGCGDDEVGHVGAGLEGAQRVHDHRCRRRAAGTPWAPAAAESSRGRRPARGRRRSPQEARTSSSSVSALSSLVCSASASSDTRI